jgi:hypothetical protein
MREVQKSKTPFLEFDEKSFCNSPTTTPCFLAFGKVIYGRTINVVNLSSYVLDLKGKRKIHWSYIKKNQNTNSTVTSMSIGTS